MKVLVLGATGMLGNAMFRYLSKASNLIVYGTARNENSRQFFPADLADRLICGLDAENQDAVIGVLATVQPDVVINCIGLVKQQEEAKNPLLILPINTILPHRLAVLCQINNARLIHMSSDCVFSGSRGNYSESDFPDANDLYGRSKLLGEVDYPNAITIRTSIIGHELAGHKSLLNWFLSQKKTVKGYTQAIFSGLPAVEISSIVRDVILPRPELHGLYHVAAQAINKFDLLNNIASIYKKEIEIVPDSTLVVDRSLNQKHFHEATGYCPPDWLSLIQKMYEFK